MFVKVWRFVLAKLVIFNDFSWKVTFLTFFSREQIFMSIICSWKSCYFDSILPTPPFSTEKRSLRWSFHYFQSDMYHCQRESVTFHPTSIAFAENHYCSIRSPRYSRHISQSKIRHLQPQIRRFMPKPVFPPDVQVFL